MKINPDEPMTLLLARDGNPDAFRRLYQLHRETIYRLAYRYTNCPQDAEDILQETFIKAFKSVKNFQSSDMAVFAAWIYRIGFNCTMEHLRRNKRKRKDKQDPLSELPNDPAAPDSPETHTINSHTVEIIKHHLVELSPKQRLVFHLRHDRHLSLEEIAGQMDCSISSVKKHLYRAVERLRKMLTPLMEEIK